VCGSHQICAQKHVEKDLKSTQNDLSMSNERNTPHLRTSTPKYSQVRIKDHYERISGIEMRPC